MRNEPVENVQKFFEEMWSVIHPLMETFGTKAGKILLVQAKLAVEAVEKTLPGSTGPEKQKAAAEMIVSGLQTSGVSCEMFAINCAIELAVLEFQYYKTHKT